MRYSRKKYAFMTVMSVLCSLPCLESCTGQGFEERPKAGLCVEMSMDCMTRSSTPDDAGIWDVNLFVYNSLRDLVHHGFYRYPSGDGKVTADCPLFVGEDYHIYAVANSGFDMGGMSLEELMQWRLFLSYPEGNIRGIPASGQCSINFGSRDSRASLELTRMMARISVNLDKSRLDKGIEFELRGIKTGNCPKSALAFGDSGVLGGTDIFTSGFYRNCLEGNDIYMLENITDSMDGQTCTYLELEIDYSSDLYYSKGRGLIYRFYLKDGKKYGARRNVHYQVTVAPRGDGLSATDSWRVDKSNLVPADTKAYLKIIPEGTLVDGEMYRNYYELQRGASMHFCFDYAPSSMDIGLLPELVQDALEEGQIRYEMDSDGRGFTATSIGGACLSMMEIVSGAPLNDFEPIAIEVI